MPDDEGPVVVDTTPLIALALLEHTELLRRFYGGVLIPPAVRAELESGSLQGRYTLTLSDASWIETAALDDPRRADLLSDLDRGEAEVLALAQERRARLVIIDEKLGRRHAQRLGLPLTGSLGVLIRAKQAGVIAELAPLLDELVDRGIYLGQPLVEEAPRLAGE